MLIALCNRNHDAISEGHLRSFLSEDFLTTFVVVIKAAGKLSEVRILTWSLNFQRLKIFHILDTTTTYVQILPVHNSIHIV